MAWCEALVILESNLRIRDHLTSLKDTQGDNGDRDKIKRGRVIFVRKAEAKSERDRG